MRRSNDRFQFEIWEESFDPIARAQTKDTLM